jgi:hypothetical protein
MSVFRNATEATGGAGFESKCLSAYKDRYRQVFGTRNVLLMNPAHLERLQLQYVDTADVFGDITQ